MAATPNAELVNTITVNRKALITNIEAKAKLNQEAYDKAVAEADERDKAGSDFKAQLEAMEKVAFPAKSSTNPNPIDKFGVRYYNDFKTYRDSMVASLFGTASTTTGRSRDAIYKPVLFEKPLAILGMSDAETLTLPTNHEFFSCI